jgi:hypothetical protein
MSILLATPEDIVRLQRTSKGQRYEAWRDNLFNLFDSVSPEDVAKVAAANEAFCKGLTDKPSVGARGAREKALTPSAVHTDTLLTTLSRMYANDEFVGERIMTVVPVDKRSNKFAAYPQRSRLAFPDDKLGFRGRANELDENIETDNYSVSDYGYKEFVDLEMVRNQDAPLDAVASSVENINHGIAFRREKRILAKAFTAGEFGGNTAAAAVNWTDATGGSIIEDVLGAKAALWRGTGATRIYGMTTLAVWNGAVVNNPKLVERFKYTQGGILLKQQIANFLGLDDIFIVSAREDTANEGQTASYARMSTAEVFGVYSVAERPSLKSLHWGSTFRLSSDPVTNQWFEPDLGKAGGIYSRVSVSEDHKVVAPLAGFLITSMLT